MVFLHTANHNITKPFAPSRGPRSSIGENFTNVFRDTAENNSMYGLQIELGTRYQDNLDRIFELAGVRLPSAAITNAQSINGMINVQEGRPFFEVGPHGVREFHSQEIRQERLFLENEAKIAELQREHPEIKSFQQIFEEVQARAQEIAGRAEETSARAGFLGDVAGFAGGMAGSFTTNDPFNVMTLGVGGFGKSMGMRVLTEAGANSAIETVNQFTGVQRNREILGLETGVGHALKSIAFAGAGAGALRGGFEGAGRGFRALEARANPNRARARVIRDEILRNTGAPLPLPGRLASQIGVRDQDILNRLKEIQTPTSRERAAIDALEADIDLRESNPFSDNRAGSILHTERLRDAINLLDGTPTRSDLKGSTAINRVARPDTPFGRLLSDEIMPRHMSETDIELLARANSPNLFKRLDDLHEQVAQTRAEVESLRDARQEFGITDVIRQTDETTAARLDAIEEELATVIPRKRRAELERERDLVVESSAPDRLETLSKRERDRMAKRVRELESQNRLAEKQIEKLEKRAKATVKKTLDELPPAIKPPAAPETPLPSLARRGEVPFENRENFGGYRDDEIVSTLLRMDDEVTPRIDEIVDGAINDARTTVQDGMVDIGLEVRVPEDFRIQITETEGMTVKEILDDILDDEALVRATRECSI